MKIWMCGHSTRSFDELQKIIKSVKYDFLIDVRTKPYSRWVSHFNRPNMERLLSNKYIFMGDTLGGLEDVTEEDFLKGLTAIRELVDKGKRLVLLCSEKDYRKCHRHLKIEPELRLCGYNIVHL